MPSSHKLRILELLNLEEISNLIDLQLKTNSQLFTLLTEYNYFQVIH